MFWPILLLIIFIVLILLIYYLSNSFKTLYAGNIKNKYLSFILSILPMLIIFIIFGYMNTIIILFHMFIFILFSKLIFLLIKKITNKKINEKIIIIIGLVISIIYLGIAYYLDHHVFETTYNVTTNKDIGVDNFRILQISDSHVGTTFDGDGFNDLVTRMNNIKDIDIVVITGDFVDDDTSKEDMIKSCEALSRFNTKYGVYYIYGNHDKGYYYGREFSASDLANELFKNNVVILEDEYQLITDNIYLIGRQDAYVSNRANIKDVVKNLDKNKYMIVLDHEPNDYQNESESEVDLVLNGHTHGGQLFPLGYVGLLLGQNDMFKGTKKINNTTFIINSGISDWAMDFKTGTKSEYTIINIKSN